MIQTDRVLSKLDEHLRRNDYVAAKRHLEYWLSEAKSVGDDRNSLLFMNELMGLTRKLSEETEALAYAEMALNQIEKMGISENVGAATSYINAATVYKAFGKAKLGLPLFEKAKEIYERNLPKNDTRLSGLYNNMGLALVDLKEFRSATEMYCKALEILQKNENSEPEQAITYLNMASAAEDELGLEDAESVITEYIMKAMSLLDSCKDLSDGNYAFVCEKCASVFGYYGYFYYENELRGRCRKIYEGT